VGVVFGLYLLIVVLIYVLLLICYA